MLPVANIFSRSNVKLVRGIQTSAVCRAWADKGWWFDNHRAGPWPVTVEEKKAAAVKYGMREEDYTPVAVDDYGGIGNYPDLGEMNAGLRDPFEAWTDPRYRRNFGEPVPYNVSITTPDGYNWTRTKGHSASGLFLKWLAWVVFFFGSYYFAYTFPIGYLKPMKPRHYPYDYGYAIPNMDPKMFPLTQYHYTFDPADPADDAEPKKEHGH